MSTAHEQNIICGKTLICRQLFACHVVGSRPMKRKDKIHGMIKTVLRFQFRETETIFTVHLKVPYSSFSHVPVAVFQETIV